MTKRSAQSKVYTKNNVENCNLKALNALYILFFMSFVCHSYVICISSVCDSYVIVCHLYVTRMYSYAIRMSLVCTRMSSVCHSYVLVGHSYVTRMYSCISFVCHSYAFICLSYVTRMWFYHKPKYE